MAGCAHVSATPPVHHSDALCPQFARLHGGVHRRHAAANDHHAPAYRHLAQVLRLTQLGNKVHRIAQAAGLWFGNPNAVDPAQAQA